MPRIFIDHFTVGADSIDLNGHVNNQEFVRWMQDVATAHSSEQGWTLDGLMLSKRGDCIPAQDGKPVMWVVMGAGVLYTRRDGSACVQVKAGQMGVVVYHADGRAEHGVFDARQLWEEMTGIRLRQMVLWEEE